MTDRPWQTAAGGRQADLGGLDWPIRWMAGGVRPAPGLGSGAIMQPLDYGVLVLYIVGCTALGARIGSGSGARGLKGYFLGESDIPGWAVMISIVATETSAVTFLSVPGNAVQGDMTFLQLAMGYILARVVVTVVLLPSYF